MAFESAGEDIGRAVADGGGDGFPLGAESAPGEREGALEAQARGEGVDRFAGERGEDAVEVKRRDAGGTREARQGEVAVEFAVDESDGAVEAGVVGLAGHAGVLRGGEAAVDSR